MNMSIKVHNADEVSRAIKELGKRLPVAVAKALTFTSEKIKVRLVAEMTTVFDRPVPYTLGSLYLQSANRASLTSSVYMKDRVSSTRLPENWLRPEIEGGNRKRKAFERALLFHGVMTTQRAYAMPGANAELDVYGNMSKGQINRMLSYFGAAENRAGYSANTSAEKKAKLAKGTRSSLGITYFALKSRRRGLAPGIWSKVANRVKPVMLFTGRPSYKSRFDFYGVGEATVNKEWPAIIEQEIEREIKNQSLK